MSSPDTFETRNRPAGHRESRRFWPVRLPIGGCPASATVADDLGERSHRQRSSDSAPASPAAGFTLVEALVVMAIIGTLAALAAPSFNELIAGQRASNAAGSLHVALIKTRSEATKRNASVTLVPSAGGWKDGWQVLDPRDSTALDSFPATTGLTISGPASVIYQGSGRVQGSAPAFEIISTALPDVKRCVSVDLSGRAFVKKGAC